MTGLLSFSDGVQSRRTSTGTMGLPKSLTRTQSLNAKYDRMLGSTQSIRTGKGSRKILAEVGTQFRLSGEEKKERVQRDNAEIYRKLGIKMPAKGSGEMGAGVGVMDRLDRYRLGNIPPPHGNTPPVELDEKLRKILYPSPPPPATLTPTPPPLQLYSEHYYPTGSRVGQRVQAVHPQTPQIDNRYQAQPSTQTYPLPPPPPLPVGGQLPPGWVYTPANGWIYIPPTQTYPSPHHGYFPVPPPPPNAPGYQGHLAYPSPYSDVHSGSEGAQSPLKSYRNGGLSQPMTAQQLEQSQRPGQGSFDPEELQTYDRQAREHNDNRTYAQGEYTLNVPRTFNQHISPVQRRHSHPAELEYLNDRVSTHTEHPDNSFATYQTPAQMQSYPKGILRDSSSESSGHGRFVKFRETPDYAYPEQFSQEVEEGPESTFCSPPQWKLRKTKAISQAIDQYQEEDTQMEQYPEDGYGSDGQDPPDLDIPEDHTSPLRGRGQNNDEIPAMLASVHQQLLSGHGVPSGAKASGKRSGRDLVRNLESLAEIQVAMDHQPQGDSQAPNFVHHSPTTPCREVLTEEGSLFPAHSGLEREQSISAGSAIRQGRTGPSKERCEETEFAGNRRVRAPPAAFESDTSRRQDPDPRRTTPRSRDRTEVQRPSSPNRQASPPSPAERHEQIQPRHEPQTPRGPSQSRKVSTNGRLPPPSQNWRENQRPQMAFSQNESMASQDMGSQLSNRDFDQDRPTNLGGKKRRRQEWRDDKDEIEYEGENHSQEGGGRSQEAENYDQEVDHHLYSPDQHSLSNHNLPQARAFELSGSQVTQEHHQARESQAKRSRSSPAPSSRPPHHRHRLTDLQIPLDDDPSDESYRPSQPEEEELEYNYSQSRSITPEEPEAKRIKVTEGAWAKYDIPQDKHPIPKQTHVPFLQAYNKSRFSHHNKNKNFKQAKSRNEVNDENIKSSQTQSQISQIENSDDEMDNWMNEDIEESWSQILSDPPERDVRGGKALSTIAEDEEDEEDEEEEAVGVEQVVDDERRGNVRWVEEGFFGDGGNKGFEIWRDRY